MVLLSSSGVPLNNPQFNENPYLSEKPGSIEYCTRFVHFRTCSVVWFPVSPNTCSKLRTWIDWVIQWQPPPQWNTWLCNNDRLVVYTLPSCVSVSGRLNSEGCKVNNNAAAYSSAPFGSVPTTLVWNRLALQHPCSHLLEVSTWQLHFTYLPAHSQHSC